MCDSVRRVFNFSAGPSALPLPVLEKVGREITSWRGCGMSVMEMSHRGKNFSTIFQETKGLFRELLGLTDAHSLLFTSAGATFNFAAVPFSFVGDGPLPSANSFADYVVSGSWSAKAAAEAQRFGPVRLWDLKNASGKYTTLPKDLTWMDCSDESRYLHYCANETVMGIEFAETPRSNKPLVSDMSSNFLSKHIDLEKHALVYAGVQKNVAPASLAVLIVSKAFLASAAPVHSCCPTLMNLPLMAEHDSLYNTPNAWSIYVAGEVAKWVKEQGGVAAMHEAAVRRSGALYDFISKSDGYYSNPVDTHSRSRMNVPFRVGFCNEELEKKFVQEATGAGLEELKGHRSVGGCRASLYNAMPMEGVEALLEFMKSFQEQNPSAPN